MEGIAVFYFLISVLIVAVVAVLFLVLSRKSTPTLNKERYQKRWLNIEHSIKKDNQASLHMAILNADKLLDAALRERGFKGTTMGERMKSAQTTWSNANHVWGAHKIRNQIAHESEYEVGFDTVRRALAAFKQGLKDLGAI